MTQVQAYRNYKWRKALYEESKRLKELRQAESFYSVTWQNGDVDVVMVNPTNARKGQ